MPAPASQPPVDESLLKQPTAPFSPPHATATQNRMTGVSPVKSTAQPAKAASPSGSKAVKRPLPEAVCPTPAAAPAAAPASLDDESALGLEPLESCPPDLPDGSADVSAVELTEGEGQMDPLEEKRLKRMRRNRESAAMSRERKKAYIEQLESKLSELSALASQLRSENDALRNGRAPLEGSAPVPISLSSTLVSRPTKPEDSLLLMPCLQTSDNDSESNDGTDSHTMEGYSLDVFSQEPPSSLTLPAEPAALFVSAIDSFDS